MSVAQSVGDGTRRALPAGWRWARLGDVCREDRDTIEPGSAPAAARPYVGLEDVEPMSGRLLRNGARHLAPTGDAQDEARSLTFAFDARHVLYGKLRPYLNKVAMPDFQGRCTTEIIPLLPQGVDRAFLAWLLRRQETVAAVMRETTGSRMPRASMPVLLALQVPLPPLPEQRRIAAILTEQLAAVDRARAAVQAQLDAAKALPAAYLRGVFESEEAKRWPRRRLGDVLYVRHDVVHPRDLPKGPAIFVGLEHIDSGTGLRTGCTRLEMSQLTGRKPRFHVGDIVYGYLRPYLNKVWVADFEGLCSVDQYVLGVQNGVLPEFVASFMRSPAFLERAPISTTPGQLPRIRTEELLAVEFNAPSKEIQASIMRRLTDTGVRWQKMLDAIVEGSGYLERMPAAILRCAFEGGL